MNAEAWIALIVGGAMLLLNLLALGVGYGVMKGQLEALTARVLALEGEMGAITELKVKVAEIATRQETWIEQLKELNAAIRWMREPAAYEGNQTSRRRGPGGLE